jgi:hypothetical protein
MSYSTGVDIDKLAVGGPGLSFIGNYLKLFIISSCLRNKFLLLFSLPGSIIADAVSLAMVYHVFYNDDSYWWWINS